MVVKVDTHDPSAVVTLLAKHLGDYIRRKGLQGHACEYATRPITKCLAATATDSALLRRCCRIGYAVSVRTDHRVRSRASGLVRLRGIAGYVRL
jgi:hypothetical protein